MKVPLSVTGNVRPQVTPFAYENVTAASPSAFGADVGVALSNAGQDLTDTAAVLQQKRDAEAQVNANQLLSQFQIDQSKVLTELNRDASPNSGIDQQFADQFVRASQDLLAQAPDTRIRQYMQNQLAQLYTNFQTQAQGFELQRNAAAVSSSLNAQFEQAKNIVLADPQQLDQQVSLLTDALKAAGGVLDQQDIHNRVQTYLQGVVEASLTGQIETGDPQLVIDQVLGGATPAEATIIQNESGGDPTIVNSFGYAGLYQFGAPLLEGLGMYTPGRDENMVAWSVTPANAPGKWSGTFNIPGHPEVHTLADFLASPAAQRAAFQVEQRWNDQQITAQGFDQYIGQTIQGVTITRAGLEYMIHAGGVGGTRNFLEGRSNPTDAYGTSLADVARLAGGVVAQAGGVNAILTNDQVIRIAGNAQTELTRRATVANQQRNSNITQMNHLMTQVQTQVDNGWAPPEPIMEQVQQLATVVGGTEGAQASSQLDFLKQEYTAGVAFAQSSPVVRSAMLNQLNQERAAGTLDANQIAVADLFDRINTNIEQHAATDGYGLAVQYGIVPNTPINLQDVGAMSQREGQAQLIHAAFGPGASVMTPEERQTLVDNIKSGDPNLAYQTMALLAYSPSLAAEVQGELATDGTAASRTYAVAMDLAAQGQEAVVKTILAGQQLLDSGQAQPATVDLTPEMDAIVHDAFAGMPAIEGAYRDAAVAYYYGALGGYGDTNTQLGGTGNWQGDFHNAVRAVLPGNVINYNGHSLVTPAKDVTQDTWNSYMNSLEHNAYWWQNAQVYDQTTNTFVPLLAPPTYADGTPIRASDIVSGGFLSEAKNGIYWAFTGDLQVMVDGMPLALNLNNAAFIRYGSPQIPGANDRVPVPTDAGVASPGPTNPLALSPSFGGNPLPSPTAPLPQATPPASQTTPPTAAAASQTTTVPTRSHALGALTIGASARFNPQGAAVPAAAFRYFQQFPQRLSQVTFDSVMSLVQSGGRTYAQVVQDLASWFRVPLDRLVNQIRPRMQ